MYYVLPYAHDTKTTICFFALSSVVCVRSSSSSSGVVHSVLFADVIGFFSYCGTSHFHAGVTTVARIVTQYSSYPYDCCFTVNKQEFYRCVSNNRLFSLWFIWFCNKIVPPSLSLSLSFCLFIYRILHYVLPPSSVSSISSPLGGLASENFLHFVSKKDASPFIPETFKEEEKSFITLLFFKKSNFT